MKRVIMIILVLVLCAGLGMAEQGSADSVAAKKSVEKAKEIDRDNDGKTDQIDVYNEDDRLIRREYDTNHDGMMEVYQTYDPNTGLPNRVPSDRAGEL